MSAGRCDLPGSPRGTSGHGEKQSQACIQLAELWFKSVLPWFDWKENICLERSWLIAVNYWPGEQTTDGQPKLDFLQLSEGSTSPKTSAALKDTETLPRAGTYRLRPPELRRSGERFLFYILGETA